MFQAWRVPLLEHAVQECGNAAQTRLNSSAQVAPEARKIGHWTNDVTRWTTTVMEKPMKTFPWTESW